MIFVDIIDISQLKLNEDTELVATIFSYDTFYEFYEPLEFKLQKKSIKVELEEYVEFNIHNNNIFEFNYNQEGDLPQNLHIHFDKYNYIYSFYIIISENNKTSLYTYSSNQKKIDKIPLCKSGTYYIEFYSTNLNNEKIIDNLFIAFIAEIFDSIDLTKKMIIEQQK